MSIVFLKNLLFGLTKRPPSREAHRSPSRSGGSYGAIANHPPSSSSSQECRAQLEEPLDGPGRKSDIEHRDDEATDVDLEAQQRENLLSSRPSIKRSRTGRGFDGDSESSSQTRAKVDPKIISDAIIGLSDGLTVPFALTAGLSTLGDVKVVIFGGLAELTAGAISMGLGGYLGAQSEMYGLPLLSFARRGGANFPISVCSESYNATFKETQELIDRSPEQTTALIYHIFSSYHIPHRMMEPIAEHLGESAQLLQCFIMKFYHNLPPPPANRALMSAITIALGYFIGGFVPLLPYFFVGKNEVLRALWWSVIVMAISLFAFGYIKTCIVQGWVGRHNVWSGVRGGVQMVVVGGLAAGAAMGLVKVFE
ncbi:hypothetical protein FGG08_004778 [Glutinoglossum americanum]|uniref:DUF125-domain-containing protein n=1 Tax=Glutinoglossum americanum TaxID=1670608 RepID=A0A9P8HZJ5_9PEZI|nr:hypothetical protein FGG08_004778 [Glutinoglossum americanum]